MASLLPQLEVAFILFCHEKFVELLEISKGPQKYLLDVNDNTENQENVENQEMYRNLVCLILRLFVLFLG